MTETWEEMRVREMTETWEEIRIPLFNAKKIYRDRRAALRGPMGRFFLANLDRDATPDLATLLRRLGEALLPALRARDDFVSLLERAPLYDLPKTAVNWIDLVYDQVEAEKDVFSEASELYENNQSAATWNDPDEVAARKQKKDAIEALERGL